MITDYTLTARPVRALRRMLDTLGYDVVLRRIRGVAYFNSPWPLDIPGLLASMTRLPDEMTALGLLRVDGENVLTDFYNIAAYDGLYFIATQPALYGPSRALGVYVGDDSYSLAAKRCT